MRVFLFLSFLLILGCQKEKTKTTSQILLYQSSDLQGHVVVPECNPGGTTSCACSVADIAINSQVGYGEVVSNFQNTNTWVNAIGLKKFEETFTSGLAISLGIYKYSYEIRLPITPVANPAQTTNAQAAHIMIQLWDGRNALWTANKRTLEAALYWNLNPWEADFGKIKVYTGILTPVLVDSGLTVTPDNQWHQFEVIANFITKKYVSAKIDGVSIDLSGIDLAEVEHLTWGDEVTLGLTTESMATYPGDVNCNSVFTWTTQFRNLTFHKYAPGSLPRFKL